MHLSDVRLPRAIKQKRIAALDIPAFSTVNLGLPRL
jgi:hypothetical protein